MRQLGKDCRFRGEDNSGGFENRHAHKLTQEPDSE